MDPAGAVQILTIVVALFLFYLGAAVGSFLNVVAYRVPAGLSIVTPRSHCPHCKTTIRWYDNVPVLAWFFLGGRCRYCGVPISGRYAAVEALTGALAVAVFWRFAPPPAEVAMGVRDGIGTAAVFFAFSAALIAVALVDWDVQIVPDEISLPGIALGVAACVVTPVTPADAAIGAACGGAVLLAVAKGYFLLTRREGMGMGDVKLLAMIGAFLGWQALPFVLLGASLSGIAVGIVLIRMRGKGLRHAFAFGPFLCAAAIAYLFVGDALTRWYLGAMGVRLLPGVGGW